jgi:predicted GNAT superfamily acetyltransferase
MTATITIRSLESAADLARAEELQSQIWEGGDIDVIPDHLIIALAHNGGLALGAFDGDRLVGVLIGFLGTDSASPERVAMARLKHCSHQLGVHPDYQNRGVGAMLKIAQRDFVMEQGVRLITWTYDPLLSRNAQLNIRRLGAVCQTYLCDAYGEMHDALNRGVPSDRFQVDWWITSRRVAARLMGDRPPLDLAHFLSAGARELNPARLGEDGLPRPCERPEAPAGNLALVEIPPDYHALRKRDLPLALEWRAHSREIFQNAFASGYMVTDFVHLGGERFPRSFYVLAHAEATLG